jgi:hypothetical protein
MSLPTAPTVTLKAWVAENGPTPTELSVAVTEKLKTPDAVGIPDSVPDEDRLNPGGRLPEEIAKA